MMLKSVDLSSAIWMAVALKRLLALIVQGLDVSNFFLQGNKDSCHHLSSCEDREDDEGELSCTSCSSQCFVFPSFSRLSSCFQVVKKALRVVKVEVNHIEYTKSYKVTGVTKEPASELSY